MVKISDGKIGTREFFSIIFFAIGINLTDTTPVLYFDFGSTAGWIVPIFSFVSLSIPLLVLISLMKKHELGLIDLLNKLTGKYIGSLICFLLFLIILSSTFINTTAYVDIVNSLFYRNIPYPILVFFLLLTCYLIAKRGLETIGRTSWLFFPTLTVVLILLIIFVWKETNWAFIFPIGGNGIKDIAIDSLLHSSTFGEIILFTAFFSYIRSYKSYRNATWIGFGLTVICIASYMALYIAVYDYPQITRVNYPHQELTKMASIGETITHLDGLFFSFWMIATIIHFSIYLYLMAFFFGGALRLNAFEPLIKPLAGLAILLALLPENINQATEFKNILLKSSSILLIALPFVLWIIDRIRGRVVNEKT